jgi:branched-chain amino acid transport system substrate-binding protein
MRKNHASKPSKNKEIDAMKMLTRGRRPLAVSSVAVSVLALTSGMLATPSQAAPATGSPIKVGVLTDMTGAFGLVGKSNKAVAQFTIDEINKSGGVLGHKLVMDLADGGSDPAIATQAASRLVNQDHVAMVVGGVASFTRVAVRNVIATRGKTIYVWPASYEGNECTKNVWNTGSAPNQQVDPTVKYLLAQGKKTFFLAGSDYLYPRNILARVRQDVIAGGGSIVGEEYVPLDMTDASNLTSKVVAAKADALFEVVVLPGTAPFIKGVVDAGYKGTIAGTLFDEGINPLIGTQAQGLIGVQDYYGPIKDTFSQSEVAKFNAQHPEAKGLFTSTFNAPAWYRSIYLWKAAVEKAGSFDTVKVNKAMDSVSLAKSIGGPVGFAPGTKHLKLSMYLGQSNGDGSETVLKSLGQITPFQCATATN